MATAREAGPLACVNAFVADTVSFLDRFAADCEARLDEVSLRISRTESLLAVLEAKLRSVPGIADGAGAAGAAPAAAPAAALREAPRAEREQQAEAEAGGGDEPKADEHVLPPKYAKLLRMKMPKEHLRLKMLRDGYDEDALERIFDAL